MSLFHWKIQLHSGVFSETLGILMENVTLFSLVMFHYQISARLVLRLLFFQVFDPW